MTQQALLQSATTLSKLESFLWEATSNLRGSRADRTDGKSYIFSLLFFKRICDVWDEEFYEPVETYGDHLPEGRRFQVSGEQPLCPRRTWSAGELHGGASVWSPATYIASMRMEMKSDKSTEGYQWP